MKMNKKGDFAWWHLMILLLAILVILFVVVWYSELGGTIKQMLSSLFDFY